MDSSSSLGLIFIIIPILVAVLILRKTNFLVALVVGDLLGIILLLILGYSDVSLRPDCTRHGCAPRR